MHTYQKVKILHQEKVATFGRTPCLLAMLFVVWVQTGCVLNNGISTRADRSTKSLAIQLGVPNCRLSDPLQVDSVFRYARHEGLAVRDPDDLRRRLAEAVEAGSEIRLIDCRAIDGRGLVEGTRYIATIKGGQIEHMDLDEILN
jgi:hypothetical protein